MQGVNGRIFDIGKSALFTFQQGIAVTGHNIANVNTPGYSRQQLVIQSADPFSSQSGQFVTGVTVTDIQRIHDSYLSARIVGEQQELGKWEAEQGILDRVEIVFNEPSQSGLSTALDEFWNAWLDLSNNPSGTAERSALIARSEYLSESFRSISSSLDGIRRDTDAEIPTVVSEINNLTETIADLNGRINQFETGTPNANDLRDQRDQAIKELSGLVGIQSYEDDSGMVSVSLLGGGKPLVAKSSAWNIEVQKNASGLNDLFWSDASISGNEITGVLSGGRLAGLIEVRDTILSDTDPDGLMTRMNELASTIISEVNTIHEAGQDLDGNTGVSFFSGSGAADIAVNVAGTANIAAAYAGSGAGDNRNAADIADLAEQQVLSGGTATASQYYAALVSDVGSVTRNAANFVESRESMLNNLEALRESVSGVSLDEEMVNLMEYQQAYTAAAKLITASNEMLDVLMNMV